MYRIVTSVKRVGVQDEKLSFQLLTMPLFLNFSSIIIVCTKFIDFPDFSHVTYMLLSTTIFVIIYLINNYYFIKKENYIYIIKKYEPKIKKNHAIIIGVIYYVMSFVLMVISSKLF